MTVEDILMIARLPIARTDGRPNFAGLFAVAFGAFIAASQPIFAQEILPQEGVGVTTLEDMGGMGRGSFISDPIVPQSYDQSEYSGFEGLDASDGVAGLIKAPASALSSPADLQSADDLSEFGSEFGAEFGARFGGAGTGLADDPGGNRMFEAGRAAPLAAKAMPIGPVAHSPVVIELFTSQGCSSCPPADDMLAELADRPDVLALSWHVDYWDYLGWADEFARPEFTLRQKDYARAAGERSIYTPQILIGGTDTLLSLRPAELMAMIDTQAARPVALSVVSRDTAEGYQIELTPRMAGKRSIAILLVRYAPVREIEVKSGENRGMHLAYRNIVLAVDRVATWDGKQPLRLKVSNKPLSGASFPPDTRHALIAQQLGRKDAVSGPILAAIKLD